MARKQKLSVCMIVKNEEVLLRRCLESVAGADEIIVCDTGSTDKTVEIAKSCGAKVTHFEWCDNFAAARNFAHKEARGDYILSIDADEYLLPGGIEEIRQKMKNNWPVIGIKMLDGDGGVFIFYRCYKRDPKIFWSGMIHNTINVAYEDSRYDSEASIVFERSPAHNKDPDRSLRILTKAVEQEPNNSRYKYYYARELFYYKKYEEAVVAFDKYLEIGWWMPERADAHLLKARCLWNLGKGEEARQACADALMCNSNFGEAAAFMAEMSWDHNKDQWLRMARSASNERVLFIRRGVQNI